MIRFEVLGLKEMERTLALVEARIEKFALAKAAEEGAEIVAEVANQMAPRGSQPNVGIRSGRPRLAGSFVTQFIEHKPGRVSVAVGPRKKAFHGIFQEFGTRHHPPQPTLRPAYDGTRDDVIRHARTVFWDEIVRAVK